MIPLKGLYVGAKDLGSLNGGDRLLVGTQGGTTIIPTYGIHLHMCRWLHMCTCTQICQVNESCMHWQVFMAYACVHMHMYIHTHVCI